LQTPRRTLLLPGMRRPALLALLLSAVAVGRLAAEPLLTLISPEKTVVLSADDFRALPHTDLTAMDPHAKEQHKYSGVLVSDLLAKVDAPLGEKLRGKALQTGVIVRSKDGYGILFALAEFDDAFSDRTLMLADTEDGQPLPANAAPLRLIAPGDKRAARWARMVTSLEVVRPGATP
jgi:DMSO/TMAO reductase YedYZ molybdopterin-dependent catalytic subunit